MERITLWEIWAMIGLGLEIVGIVAFAVAGFAGVYYLYQGLHIIMPSWSITVLAVSIITLPMGLTMTMSARIHWAREDAKKQALVLGKW